MGRFELSGAWVAYAGTAVRGVLLASAGRLTEECGRNALDRVVEGESVCCRVRPLHAELR